jgi:transketolase
MSIAQPRLNVKVIATHGGISVGEDGFSHHAIEDLSLACSLPGIRVIVPADALTEREWMQFKKDHAKAVIKEWQKFAPNMTWDNVIGYGANTPYDTAHRLPTGVLHQQGIRAEDRMVR